MKTNKAQRKKIQRSNLQRKFNMLNEHRKLYDLVLEKRITIAEMRL